MVLNRLVQANNQFRLQEAAGLFRLLAEDYPGLLAWADGLDQYHAFLMAALPGREDDALPFASTQHTSRDADIVSEVQRLNSEWRNASPATRAFVIAYWSVSNWDGIRAAAWLLHAITVGGISHNVPAHITNGLREIVQAFCEPYSSDPPLGGGDLYISLQVVADALPSVEKDYPIERADDFRWLALPTLDALPGTT